MSPDLQEKWDLRPQKHLWTLTSNTMVKKKAFLSLKEKMVFTVQVEVLQLTSEEEVLENYLLHSSRTSSDLHLQKTFQSIFLNTFTLFDGFAVNTR